jgi:hypothetical protein
VDFGDVPEEEYNELMNVTSIKRYKYPDCWHFEDDMLQLFNPDYDLLNRTRKELTQRRFFNFAKYFLKVDPTPTEIQAIEPR